MADYPAKLNLVCRTNQTFTRTFTWLINGTPVDLSSASIAMQLKWNGGTVAKVSLSDGSGIVNGGALGTITATIPASTMATLVVGDYDYDLVVTIGTVKTPLVYGTFTVEQGTTS